MAALLFKGRGVFITGLLLAVCVGIIYWLEVAYPNSNPSTPAPIINVAIMNIFVISLTGFMLQLSSNNLYKTLDRARKNEIEQIRANQELLELKQNLEERVKERTEELQKSYQETQKRASQIQAIAEIASSITALKEFDELLKQTTETISERFNFYHVGIFLVDDDHEFAVLRAANSEGGQRMLVRKHKLKIGQEGIVGSAVASGRARIALDVGDDAVYFNNPDLPATHSEMALPLKIGDNIIGALDVQSQEVNAFSEEDIEVLETLANQITVAIRNALLYNQTQQALHELEQNLERYTQSTWSQQTSRSGLIGYKASENGLEPVRTATSAKTQRLDTYVIPLKLRQVTFGKMGIKTGKRIEDLTEDQKAIIQAAADRVALALENARLFEDAQRKA
ncbi:MAG TPA: GAF domain-containing protein, partial [Pseudomonadales bacterium]|nr:GAF domain-containing protein [Pseudomonadales bacterium]